MPLFQNIDSNFIYLTKGYDIALNEIAKASKVSIVIDESLIPLHEETYKLANTLHTNPVDYALLGGEDFQLVFTAPKELSQALEQLGYEYIEK